MEERLPGLLTAVVDLPDNLPVEQAVQRYEADPAVEWAEPDFILQPSDVTPNDPGFSDLYGLNNTGQSGGTEGADISAPGAWSVTTGSEDTIIAVIDTGVDVEHPDLEGNVWTNPNESANGRDDSGNGLVDDVNGWDFHNDDNSVYNEEDGDEHGTHVAGTVAAEGDNEVGVTGVNWQAQIMPLKFLGPSGGFTSNAVKAIDYAVDNGATISNNSWGGGGRSQALQDAITRAGEAGHLFVAAAGNAGNDNDANPFYPASYDNENIVSVAATDSNDQIASFSNFGQNSVDLGAPGVRIVSTLPGDNYGAFSGTSMAAPHVAGTAGLLKSTDSGLDAAQLKQQMLENTDRLSSLENRAVTGGRLNAADSLSLEEVPPRPTETNVSAGRSVLVFGQGTNLFGGLTDSSGEPVAGEEVVLLQRPVDQDRFRPVSDGAVTTDSNGRFVVRGVSPQKHTIYRARFAGKEAEGLEPSISGPERVNVRVRVGLQVRNQEIQLGQRQGMAGRVFPGKETRVRLVTTRNGEFFDARWRPLDGNSIYRHVFQSPQPGIYRVTATFPRDDEHLGNRSPQRSFRVVR